MHPGRRMLVRIVNILSVNNACRRSIRPIAYFANLSLFGPRFDLTKIPNCCVDTMSMSTNNSDNSNVRHGASRLCWHCGKAAATHAPADHDGVLLLCSHCRRLQPLPPHIDFFSYFGLDDPAGAAIFDGTELKRRFRRMQSLVHPDKFVGRDEHERSLSAQHSAFLNNAYRTLREPFARAEYLLSLLETVKSGAVASSSSGNNLSTESAFANEEGTVEDNAMAAEMMELMESIERMEPDSTQIGQRLVELDLEIYRLLRKANDQMMVRDIPEARQTMRRISYLRRSRKLLEAKRSGERWSGEHNE